MWGFEQKSAENGDFLHFSAILSLPALGVWTLLPEKCHFCRFCAKISKNEQFKRPGMGPRDRIDRNARNVRKSRFSAISDHFLPARAK